MSDFTTGPAVREDMVIYVERELESERDRDRERETKRIDDSGPRSEMNPKTKEPTFYNPVLGPGVHGGRSGVVELSADHRCKAWEVVPLGYLRLKGSRYQTCREKRWRIE